MRLPLACLIIAVCARSTAAAADPCKAIPDHGPLPAYLSPGSAFSGPVRYVGDGDSLCIEVDPTDPPRPANTWAGRSAGGPSTWVEIRLADFYAPELHEPGGEAAKRRLEEATSGQTLNCIAEHRSYDRVVAQCGIGRVLLRDRLRELGAREGGRGYLSR